MMLCTPFLVAQKSHTTFSELEECGFRVARHDDQQTQELQKCVSNVNETFLVEILIDSSQDSLDQGVSLTNQTIQHGHLSCHQEVLKLLLYAF